MAQKATKRQAFVNLHRRIGHITNAVNEARTGDQTSLRGALESLQKDHHVFATRHILLIEEIILLSYNIGCRKGRRDMCND